MRPVARVYLYDGEERFFGEGPYCLLCGIEETGSLRKAAAKMELSYSKALHMISRAEQILGFSLTEKMVGGKGGGGSRLTPQAKEFLEKYKAYREACYEANRRIYEEIYGESTKT